MVMSKVRRSPRLNKEANGFNHCTPDDMPMKKKKNNADLEKETRTILPSSDGGLGPEDVRGPILVEILQDWGVECGASPSEITDALLKGHSPPVPNDD